MTELERKAVLGDKQAQKKCTEKGIILPCPKCFDTVNIHGPEDWKPSLYDPDSGGDPYEFYCKCGLVFCTSKYDFKEALSDWNERPVQPIGRCCMCKHFDNEGKHPVCWHTGLRINSGFYYCCYFEAKEDTNE